MHDLARPNDPDPDPDPAAGGRSAAEPQAEAEAGEGTDLEQVAAGGPVAEPLRISQNAEHQAWPRKGDSSAGKTQDQTSRVSERGSLFNKNPPPAAVTTTVDWLRPARDRSRTLASFPETVIPPGHTATRNPLGGGRAISTRSNPFDSP